MGFIVLSGRYVKQSGGYSAFIPETLLPLSPIPMDAELTKLLSDADRALGRLDGVASILPNPDLFVTMYVRQEAVFSSQIEGTQSTLEDILQFEVDPKTNNAPKDVREVVNHVISMNYGLDRLKELPLCLRLIREMHEILLKGARGENRSPGEFRKQQNWVGEKGSTIFTAAFVPPPVPDMLRLLDDLEHFLHDTTLPVLLHCGLAHAQFETIHPFMDGNGRVGRALIAFILCEREVLQRPLLYLSHYFKAHRAEYYDRLMAVRNESNWDGWLKFFLKGVFIVSQSATDTARAILQMREDHRQSIIALAGNTSAMELRLLEFLFEQPMVSIRMVEKHLGCVYRTAGKVIDNLVSLGILREITGQQRNRIYAYKPYIDVFDLLEYRINAGENNNLMETKAIE